MGVLLVAVVVSPSHERAILVAEIFQDLANFVDKLLVANVLALGMGDDNVDGLVLEGIQGVHKVELPLKFLNVLAGHVCVQQARAGFVDVAQTVQAAFGGNYLDDHGVTTRASRTLCSSSLRSSSWALRAPGSTSTDSDAPDRRRFSDRASWFRFPPILPNWP